VKKRTPIKLKAIDRAHANLKLFLSNRLLGISDSKTLGAIIDTKKVIIAVWRDDFEPDPYGMLFVNGREQDLSGLPDDEVNAIPCSCGDDHWQPDLIAYRKSLNPTRH